MLFHLHPLSTLIFADSLDAVAPEAEVIVTAGRRDPMFYKGQPERRSASAHFTLDPQVSIDVDTMLQATSPTTPCLVQELSAGNGACWECPSSWQMNIASLMVIFQLYLLVIHITINGCHCSSENSLNWREFYFTIIYVGYIWSIFP